MLIVFIKSDNYGCKNQKSSNHEKDNRFYVQLTNSVIRKVVQPISEIVKRLRNIMPVSLKRNDGCVAQNMRTSLMHVDRRRIRVMGKLDEVKVNCLISQKHKDPLQRRWCGSWTYPRARSISSGQDTRTRMKKSHILH